jgi:hypothetical protein
LTPSLVTEKFIKATIAFQRHEEWENPGDEPEE